MLEVIPQFRMWLVLSLVGMLATDVSALPCSQAPDRPGTIKSIATISTVSTNIDTEQKSTSTGTTLTYMCQRGMEFPDLSMHKTFICSEITDWEEQSKLECKYRMHSSVCLWMTSTEMTYYKNKDHCLRNGAILAEIFTNSDQASIKSRVQNKRAFIGVTNVEDSGVFQLAYSGIPIDNLIANWSVIELHTRFIFAHCTVMDETLALYPCKYKAYAVCEERAYDKCASAPIIQNARMVLVSMRVTYSCNKGFAFPDNRVSISISCGCKTNWISSLKDHYCQSVMLLGNSYTAMAALQKAATQEADMYNYSNASKAVDGNKGTSSQTKSSVTAWWKVDLENSYVVEKVRIIQSKCCDLPVVEVRVGHVMDNFTQNALCYRRKVAKSQRCDKFLTGSVVSIQIQVKELYQLTLCEVEVGGTKTGRNLSMVCWSQQSSFDECKAMGGYKAILVDGLYNRKIKEGGATGVIGLFYDLEMKQWLWDTFWEEPTLLSYSGFTNWNSQPDNLESATSMCTYIGDDGKWYYKVCDSQDSIICEYPKNCDKALNINYGIKIVKMTEVVYICYEQFWFHDAPYAHNKTIACTCDVNWVDIRNSIQCRWGTTDDFATSFLQCSLFVTALWDFPNSRPVHSIIWVAANFGIFIGYFLKYNEGVEYHYIIEILGLALPFARASAAALNMNCMLVLLPVLRNCLSLIRGSCRCCKRNLRRQLDKNIEFHKLFAYGIIFHTIVHYYAHCYNMEYFMLAHDSPDLERRGLLQALTLLPSSNNGTWINPIRTPTTNPTAVILSTWAGLTGVVITFALILIYSSATEVIRRSYFEVFWFTHHLFVIFFVGLCLHGVGGLVRSQSNLEEHDPHKCDADYKHWGKPGHCPVPIFKAGSAKTWYWIIGPMFMYFVERMFRFVRSFQKVVVTKVVRHPSKVVELQMQKKNFRAESGQYIFLKCPSISHFEWHPFTLTSAAQDDFFSVHIRIAGDWTNKLYQAVHADQGDFQDSWLLPQIAVDGPFGTATEDIFRYQTDVFVAAGIGVTPFASILKDIWYQHTGTSGKNGEMKLRKVYFYWICPDTNAFEWFADLLINMETQLADAGIPEFLDYNIFLTRGWSSNQAFHIATHDEDPVDVITGLRNKTQFGRPTWETIFTHIAQQHAGTSIGVFLCGPEALSQTLEALSNKHSNLEVGTKFFYNKENF